MDPREVVEARERPLELLRRRLLQIAAIVENGTRPVRLVDDARGDR